MSLARKPTRSADVILCAFLGLADEETEEERSRIAQRLESWIAHTRFGREKRLASLNAEKLIETKLATLENETIRVQAERERARIELAEIKKDLGELRAERDEIKLRNCKLIGELRRHESIAIEDGEACYRSQFS